MDDRTFITTVVSATVAMNVEALIPCNPLQSRSHTELCTRLRSELVHTDTDIVDRFAICAFR
jgi:hypothetical protein